LEHPNEELDPFEEENENQELDNDDGDDGAEPEEEDEEVEDKLSWQGPPGQSHGQV